MISAAATNKNTTSEEWHTNRKSQSLYYFNRETAASIFKRHHNGTLRLYIVLVCWETPSQALHFRNTAGICKEEAFYRKIMICTARKKNRIQGWMLAEAHRNNYSNHIKGTNAHSPVSKVFRYTKNSNKKKSHKSPVQFQTLNHLTLDTATDMRPRARDP